MSLRLIYGRSGTGKSQYCFKEISKRIEQEQIYIITPEQFSFTAEKKLLDSLMTKAVIHAEVLTFHRMAYRVMQEVGGVTKVNLSKSGKAMLIYRILSKQKKQLRVLGKSEENIQTIGTAITEFKKHHITTKDLKQVIEETDNAYLKIKLEDLSRLYEAYEQSIENNYIDEEDNLTLLVSQLEDTNMFQKTVIYIDEFVGFTKQEQEVIRKLLKVAKQVNITVCTEDLKENQKKETDIFYSNKETANRLLQMARQEHITIEEDVVLQETKRFKTPELQYLEQAIYSKNSTKYEKKIENVQLYLAMNPFSEIEEVAKQIVGLVRNEEYRYKEIAVIAKNLDIYSNLTKVIFKGYNIPIFLDEKKELSQNVLIKQVLALLEIFSKNWSYEAMFNYIKTGLCNLCLEDAFLLENYCIKWGIKGNKWYKGPWEIADTEEELEMLERFEKANCTTCFMF